MELVPIIYTALSIFAILAVGTILISYLLYKIKAKDEKDIDEDERPAMELKADMLKPDSTRSSSQKKTAPQSKRRPKKPARKKTPVKRKSEPKPDPIKKNKRITILNQETPDEISQTKTSTNKKDHPKRKEDDDSEFFRLDTSKKNRK